MGVVNINGAKSRKVNLAKEKKDKKELDQRNKEMYSNM